MVKRHPRFHLLVTGLSICTLVILCGCVGTLGGGDGFQRTIWNVQSQVFPALVFVKPITQRLGAGERVLSQTFGSGVIISPDGLVVTNSHVAKDATQINCMLFTEEELPAQVVGLDPETDLALLQLELPEGHAPLPTASFGDSSLVREGDFVMAMGSPFGFSRSSSFGIISSTRRYLDVGDYTLWLQTDAAINPGNSGGPLVNGRGLVIGINTLRARSGDNIGFAIPANMVKRVVASLRQKGRVDRSYSGIQFQPVKDFMRGVILDHDRGVVVAGVDERSPAATAGLAAGDLILEYNGKDINGIYLEDLPEVRCLFASLPADEPVELMIRRNGSALTKELLPAARHSSGQEGIDLEAWNCSAKEISKFVTPNLAFFAPRGVYILGTRRPGNAYASGLRSGDIILSIDNEPVPTLESLRNIYRKLSRLDRGSRTALFEVLRRGSRRFVVLDFNSDYDAMK